MPKKDTKHQQTTITVEEMSEAIRHSGYLLEGRVEGVLRRRGYTVLTNVPIPDQSTGKPRELDLAALQSTALTSPGTGQVTFSLHIECVNNLYPMAFFTKGDTDADDRYDTLKVGGIPLRGYAHRGDSKLVYLPRVLKMDTYHHYFKERPSTQWCSFMKKKDGGWMAYHYDDHYEVFKKLGDAVEYTLAAHHTPEDLRKARTLNLHFAYALLVLQNDIVVVDPLAELINPKNADLVQYHHQTIRGSEEHTYHIDVVRESYLPQMLDSIEQETRTTIERLSANWGVVSSATALALRTMKLSLGLYDRLWKLGDDDV